jgi:hypothetical protein
MNSAPSLESVIGSILTHSRELHLNDRIAGFDLLWQASRKRHMTQRAVYHSINILTEAQAGSGLHLTNHQARVL